MLTTFLFDQQANTRSTAH